MSVLISEGRWVTESPLSDVDAPPLPLPPQAFTLDGPHGPAEAASIWTLKSWDRTQVPKPFTTVAMAVGEPIYVPREADNAALETWRQRLQQSLADCRKKCAELLWH